MSLRQVTVGVAGTADVSDALVCDALNEHFAFGPADAEGYFGKSAEFDVHLAFPVGERRFTSGIENVWQWAVRAEIPFLAISDNTAFPQEKTVRSTLMSPDDWQYADRPEDDIVELLTKSVNPLLLVITDHGAYSRELRETAGLAMAAGIPVYDLTRALLEQHWRDLGLTQEEGEALYAVPQSAPGPSGVLIDAEQAQAIAATLAQIYSMVQELRQIAGTISDLQPALARAERALRIPEPTAQPRAQEPAPEPAPEPDTGADDGVQDDGQAGTPPARHLSVVEGGSVDPKKTRLEIYDEESGQWRPAGRGRPKQGVKTRRVPR